MASFGAASFGGVRCNSFKSNVAKLNINTRPPSGGCVVGRVAACSVENVQQRAGVKRPKTRTKFTLRILCFARNTPEGLVEDRVVESSYGSYENGVMTLNVKDGGNIIPHISIKPTDTIKCIYAQFDAGKPDLKPGDIVYVCVKPEVRIWKEDKTLDDGTVVKAGDVIGRKGVPTIYWDSKFPNKLEVAPEVRIMTEQLRQSYCIDHLAYFDEPQMYFPWNPNTRKFMETQEQRLEYLHMTDGLNLLIQRDGNGDVNHVSWTANFDFWGDPIEVGANGNLYAKDAIDVARIVVQKDEQGVWRHKLYIFTCYNRADFSWYMNVELWGMFARTVWHYFKGVVSIKHPAWEKSMRDTFVQKQYSEQFVPMRPDLPSEVDDIVKANPDGSVDLGPNGFDLVVAKISEITATPDWPKIAAVAGTPISNDMLNNVKARLKIYGPSAVEPSYTEPNRDHVIMNQIPLSSWYLISPEIYTFYAITPIKGEEVFDDNGEVQDTLYHHTNKLNSEEDLQALLDERRGKIDDVLIVAVRRSYIRQSNPKKRDRNEVEEQAEQATEDAELFGQDQDADDDDDADADEDADEDDSDEDDDDQEQEEEGPIRKRSRRK